MRTSYWSNSAFADYLRKVSGIKKQPGFATMDGWKEYERHSNTVAPIMNKMIDYLDNIQKAVYWIPDTFDSIVYFFSNIKNRSHVLRTTTKPGKWSDLVTKIPDALMFAVIDFVEKECFWMNIMSIEEEGILKYYANQSYLMRKLFPIPIGESIRGREGIKWLEWQIEASKKGVNGYTQTEKCYDAIIAAYKFAKERYFKFDAWEESGYNEADDAGVFGKHWDAASDKRSEYYKKIRILEEEFENQVSLHCGNIVKYRESLWT